MGAAFKVDRLVAVDLDAVSFVVEAKNAAEAGLIADELVYAVACHRGIYPNNEHPKEASRWAMAATDDEGQREEVV